MASVRSSKSTVPARASSAATHLIAEVLAIEGRSKALMAAVEAYDLESSVAKRKADPYPRGVKWFKVLNAAYSQREGRHDPLNGDWRAIRAAVTRVPHPSGDSRAP